MLLNEKPERSPGQTIQREDNYTDPSLPCSLGLQSLIKDGPFTRHTQFFLIKCQFFLHSKPKYSLFSLFLAFRLFQEHFICIYNFGTMYRFAVITKQSCNQTYKLRRSSLLASCFLFPDIYLIS